MVKLLTAFHLTLDIVTVSILQGIEGYIDLYTTSNRQLGHGARGCLGPHRTWVLIQ